MSGIDYTSPAEAHRRHNAINTNRDKIAELDSKQQAHALRLVATVGEDGNGGKVAELERRLEAEITAREKAETAREKAETRATKAIARIAAPRKKKFALDTALTGVAVGIAATIAEVLRRSGAF